MHKKAIYEIIDNINMNFADWLDEKRVYTFKGVFLSIIGILARIFIAFVALGVTPFFIVPSSVPSLSAKIPDLKYILSQINLLYLSLFTFILVAVDFYKEFYIRSKQNDVFKEYEEIYRNFEKEFESKYATEMVIYKLIGGIIKETPNKSQEPESNNYRLFFLNILTRIEKITELTLRQSNSDYVGNICANIMVFDKNKNCLTLKHWGTKLDGRDDISLPINDLTTIPCAPTAYLTGELQYVPNTQSDEFKSYFSPEKDYRSIISIPIPERSDTVHAVLNIDSTLERQFNDISMVKVRVQPLINLIGTQKHNL